MAAEPVLHMQKALDQMDVRIHRVINEITGVSGLKIIDAILAGQRDPLALAGLCHGGVKNSVYTIAKSLDLRAELYRRRIRSRVATALRMGVQSLHHARDYLEEFFPAHYAQARAALQIFS